MFADRAKIYIRSGKGGDGHVSFRRELYVPNGGPDGGDGGRGGDVIFEVDKGLNALTDYRHKRKYAAGNGEEGGKKRCHGADGKDIVLKVPEGTVIKEAVSGKVIADMSGGNTRQIVLKGGRGGKGNQHYATATMQVPKYAQPGQPAQELEVLLELKVIADVGLIGFPNVGKSTLLSRVSNARPQIANYHFTTLNPHLGVVDLEDCGGFVIADIPGLIEGASEGVGLGHQFLRHIERTRVLIHLVDAASTEGRDPVEDIYKINKELEAYDPELLKRPQVIAANKVDAIYTEDEDPVERIRSAPDENSDWVGKLYKDSAAQVLEYLDGWTKIRSGSAEGYVPADALITGGEAEQHAEEYENNTVTVTARVLNVREGQGTDTSVLTQIELDEQYQVTSEPVDGWYPVKVGDIDGWVSGEYVTEETSYSYGETKEEEEERIAEEKAEQERKEQEAAEKEAAEASASSVSSTGVSGQAVIDYACQFVGNPYVWGGTSLTNGADCSGFVQSVYAHFGINLPRTTYDMVNSGYAVSYEEAQPGDLILYGDCSHVGLYMGDGNIVNALNSDKGICICSATYTNIYAVRRVL